MNRHPEIDPDQDPKNDPAWELLLEARKTEAGPFFVRNVLRAVRLDTDLGSDLEKTDRAFGGWLAIFSLPRLAVTAAAAAIVVSLVVLNPFGATDTASVALQDTKTPTAPVTVRIPVAPALVDEEPGFDMGDYQDEIEMIDYFDDLLAVQDVSALDDEALSELLF